MALSLWFHQQILIITEKYKQSNTNTTVKPQQFRQKCMKEVIEQVQINT